MVSCVTYLRMATNLNRPTEGERGKNQLSPPFKLTYEFCSLFWNARCSQLQFDLYFFSSRFISITKTFSTRNEKLHEQSEWESIYTRHTAAVFPSVYRRLFNWFISTVKSEEKLCTLIQLKDNFTQVYFHLSFLHSQNMILLLLF